MQCLARQQAAALNCRHGATSTSCTQPSHANLVRPRQRTMRLVVCTAAASSLYEPKAYERVADAMTSGSVFTCSPEDTVDQALEMLVKHRITGLPVVDASEAVLIHLTRKAASTSNLRFPCVAVNGKVGVVSDYDLLALDKLGQVKDDRALFPAADQTWQAFKEVKTLLAKSSGKKVKDVMTATPIVVRPDMDLDEAARILLSKKIHRLPVVDEGGKLVGVLSRGNIVKAALAMRQASKQ